MIIVAGEALIDLISEGGALRAHPGGGPFNSAVALGRLGVPVGFLGRLSDDPFGQLLASFLQESGVDGRYVIRGPAPTPIAVVHEAANGDHEFAFYLTGTAYADFTAADLPEFGPEVDVVSAGTLALATEPPASAIEALLEREAERRLIVIDPNIRPAVFGSCELYRRRFERFASLAHVVKLSDADASWLYPGEDMEVVVDRLVALGARLAVLTLGVDGALAKTQAGRAEVASPRVDVVDTVGAGDAFGAGLLRWLWVSDRLDADAVARIDGEALADGLGFAAAMGALQCSRAGATPSTLAEVEAFLGRMTGPPSEAIFPTTGQ
ncbi:MAG: carbohydrate kinase [Actinomycetota bacterium]|nr:carbohydrate kinase [Actinomycetota bacterium]